MDYIVNQELRNILLKKGNLLSQKAIANLCGVSQATVSGWFAGYRKPRLSHLVNLARAIGIDPIELANAGGYNPQDVYRLYAKSQVSAEDIFFAKTNLDTISKVRISGNNYLALDISKQVLDWINIKLKQVNSYQELLEVKAELLLNVINIYNEILLPKDFLKVTDNLIKDIQEICQKIDNIELFYMAEFMRGDGYYLMTDYAASANKLLVCLDYVKNIDYRLWILRTLALDYAYLNQINRFKNIYKEIKVLIEEDKSKHPEILCIVYEGLGRAESLLGIASDLDAIDEAWKIYGSLVKKKVNQSPLIEIGIKRSMMEIIYKTQPKEYSLLENIGNDVIKMSEQFSYHRYTLKAQEILRKCL